jgi:hypothetical protein
VNAPDLREEIAVELEALETTVNELLALQKDVAHREPTVRKKAAAAAFLAQFYNGVENILKRICRYHDVPLPAGETWHVELFQRFCSPPHANLPLLFDETLAAALAPYRRFRHVAETFTRRSVGVVANGHFHHDHIWGNQAFGPNTQIVSSIRTRPLVSTAGMKEFQWYAANSARKLASLRSQLELAQDTEQRSELSLWIGYYEGLVEALPHLSVRLPTITFENRLVIHGAKRSAELITFEDAHTGSDTVLWLPEDKIIFMSICCLSTAIPTSETVIHSNC